MAVATVNGIDLNYRLEGDGEETIVCYDRATGRQRRRAVEDHLPSLQLGGTDYEI